MKNNQRKHCRQKVDIDVRYCISDFQYSGKSCDISPGGIFINAMNDFPIGKEISLSINMPNRSATFKIVGNIARNEKEGFGVRFKQPLNALLFHEERFDNGSLYSEIQNSIHHRQ